MLQEIGRDFVTIHDVAASMGMVLDKHRAWRVGDIMQERYKAVAKAAPVKDLRRKKNGGGSHCFALYSSGWIEEIKAVILSVEAELAAQLDLFYPCPAVVTESAAMGELFGGLC